MGAAESLVESICQFCGTVSRGTVKSSFCSDDCRTERKRERDHLRYARPGDGAPRRPWSLGAPAPWTHIPGGACAISVTPHPKWPIELRNTRGLHGAISTILGELGEAHHTHFPLFALIPWKSGWAVHWNTEGGARLTGGTFEAALFDRPTRFHFGPLVRLRAPTGIRRARQRVRLDTVTPAIIRNDGGAVPCTRPTALSIVSALTGSYQWRLGIKHLRAEDLCVELVDAATSPSRTPLGGKYGDVPGWDGSVTLDVNAPARWLLEVASRIGFGGRTAFGFGRIRVTGVR